MNLSTIKAGNVTQVSKRANSILPIQWIISTGANQDEVFQKSMPIQKDSLWKQGCLSTPPQGVHYFMLLTDDKHLVGKGANAMIGKLQRIHNFTLFAASHSPAPRQSVVDDRTPQIMDWDVGSKDFQRLACKTWKCYWVISGPVSSFAHKNSWKDGPISHFIATSTALFVCSFHLFVCCMI